MVILFPHDVDSVRTALGAITRSPTVLLYVGPDQLMPLTSILGAIVGVALIFWNKIVTLTRKGLSLFSRRGAPPADATPPEPQSKPAD